MSGEYIKAPPIGKPVPKNNGANKTHVCPVGAGHVHGIDMITYPPYGIVWAFIEDGKKITPKIKIDRKNR